MSDKTTMNFDMYVEEGITQIQLKLVSNGGDSLYKTLNPAIGEWVSHEAIFTELEVLSGTLDPSTLKLAGFIVFGEAGSSFYVDNIYFSGESIFSELAVTVTGSNDSPILGAIVSVGSVSETTDANGKATLSLQEGEHAVNVSVDGMALAQIMQSNIGGDATVTVIMQELYLAPSMAAPAPEISNEDAFVLYSDALNVDKYISYWEDNWSNAPLYSEVQVAGNNTAKFQITPEGVEGGVTGIQYGIEGGSIDVSDKTGLRFDMYATSGITQAVFQIIPADGTNKGIHTMPVITGEWITVELPFSDLVKPSGQLNAEQLAQLGLQLWGTTKDTVYLDNIYFY
ncbi:MAG: carbohydrate binding domain-containing protein [Psychromonas sp.]